MLAGLHRAAAIITLIEQRSGRGVDPQIVPRPETLAAHALSAAAQRARAPCRPQRSAGVLVAGAGAGVAGAPRARGAGGATRGLRVVGGRLGRRRAAPQGRHDSRSARIVVGHLMYAMSHLWIDHLMFTCWLACCKRNKQRCDFRIRYSRNDEIPVIEQCGVLRCDCSVIVVVLMTCCVGFASGHELVIYSSRPRHVTSGRAVRSRQPVVGGQEQAASSVGEQPRVGGQ